MDNSVKVANEQGLEMQPYTSFRIVRTFVDCADCTDILSSNSSQFIFEVLMLQLPENQ